MIKDEKVKYSGTTSTSEEIGTHCYELCWVSMLSNGGCNRTIPDVGFYHLNAIIKRRDGRQFLTTVGKYSVDCILQNSHIRNLLLVMGWKLKNVTLC